jgi:DNA repair protein RecO (recombination protein O)
MQWTDEGTVLGVRRQGETHVILELMTREHGRHLGLVRGGRGSRMRPVLQPGNQVRATWRARLDEHLGYFHVEALELRTAALFKASHAVFGVAYLAVLCRLLPERDPHPDIHEALTAILDHIDDRVATGANMARFELKLLAELGFGLALDRCAVTGGVNDLIFVSPKSGRAVSAGAGAPFKNKLLRLPPFLHNDHSRPAAEELADGFRLTGFFLARQVLEPRGKPHSEVRSHFLDAVLK